MKDFEIYSIGFIYASVCSSLSLKDTMKRLNEARPTGLDHGWELAEECFSDGTDNPHSCERAPKTHKHYLFSC